MHAPSDYPGVRLFNFTYSLLSRLPRPIRPAADVYVLVCLVATASRSLQESLQQYPFVILVLQMVNLNSDNSIAASDRLIDLIADVVAAGSLRANETHRDRGVLEPFVDECLNRCIALLLGFFPERAVLEASG